MLVSLPFIGTFLAAMVLGVVGDLFDRGHHRPWTSMITVAVTIVATAFLTVQLTEHAGMSLAQAVIVAGASGIRTSSAHTP
jgi:hypothetical protein